MKPDKKGKAGRPPVSATNKATTPAITVKGRIQDNARRAASRMGIGFSEFCSDAIFAATVRADTEWEANQRAELRAMEDPQADANDIAN